MAKSPVSVCPLVKKAAKGRQQLKRKKDQAIAWSLPKHIIYKPLLLTVIVIRLTDMRNLSVTDLQLNYERTYSILF